MNNTWAPNLGGMPLPPGVIEDGIDWLPENAQAATAGKTKAGTPQRPNMVGTTRRYQRAKQQRAKQRRAR